MGLLFTIFLQKIKHSSVKHSEPFAQPPSARVFGKGWRKDGDKVNRPIRCSMKSGKQFECGQTCKRVAKCGNDGGKCGHAPWWLGGGANWCCWWDKQCTTKKCDYGAVPGRWIDENTGDPLCKGENKWELWYNICDDNDDLDPDATCNDDCKQKIKTTSYPKNYTAYIKDHNASTNGVGKINIAAPDDFKCTKRADCRRNDGACDCKGITLPCSINCETGSNRFIVTQEKIGGGSDCNYPGDCEDGDGVCDSNRLKTVGSGGSWPDKISSIDEMNRARQLIIPPWVGEVMTWDEHQDKSTIDEDKKSKLKTIYRYDLMDSGESCVEDVDGGSLVGSYIYKIEENKRDLYRKCDGLYDSSGSFVREYV